MTGFLDQEKVRQAEFKIKSPYFSELGRREGVYKGKARPFCLPLEQAEENLFPGIRESACDYF